MISQLSIYLLHIHLCPNHIILTTQTFSKSGFIHGQQIPIVPNPQTKVIQFHIFLTDLFLIISIFKDAFIDCVHSYKHVRRNGGKK